MPAQLPAFTMVLPRARRGVAVIVGTLGLAAAAQAADTLDARVATRLAPTPSMEVVALDGRLVPASDGAAPQTMSGLGYRMTLRQGRAGFALGVGTLRAELPSAALASPATVSSSVPVVSVGWRYAVRDAATVYADASRAGQGLVAGAEDAPLVNAKVGVEWKPAGSTFGLEQGGVLGMRLDSGYRMSVKLRRSGFGVYMRGQF